MENTFHIGHIRTNQVICTHSTTPPKKPDDSYTLHCHNHYELYYLAGGSVEYLIEGRPYHPEDNSILLIEPNVFHGFLNLGDRDYERYTVHFLPDIFTDTPLSTLLDPFHNKAVYYENADKHGLRDQLELLLDCATLPEKLHDGVASARLISALSIIYKYGKSCVHVESDNAANTKRFNVEEILSYINLHLSEPLSLDDICSRFYISKNHLNRIFHTAAGTTVINYINHKRVALAKQHMSNGKTAGEAAYQAGFQDYSTFYRAYKRILGVSPTDTKNANYTNI